MHIAFKCNWNDGRRRHESEYPGWSARCTWETIQLNVRSQRPWCSNQANGCAKAVAGKMHPDEISARPCFESMIFTEAKFSPGPGKKIRQAGPGELAFFTTRHPEASESERVVIGAMRIKAVNVEGDYLDECLAIVGDRQSLVRLKEPQFPLYWSLVKSTPQGAAWDTGLVRYVDDEESRRLVAAMHWADADVSPLDVQVNENSFIIANAVADPDGRRHRDYFIDKALLVERTSFVRNSDAARLVRSKGKCEACGLEAVRMYGSNVLEAHHRTLFAEMAPNTRIHPEKDLAALCANCHRALHQQSKRGHVMPVEEFANALLRWRKGYQT